jgi:HK97 family phage portal protein
LTELQNRLNPETASMLRTAIDKQIESAGKGIGLSQLAHIWLTGGDLTGSSQSKPTKPYKQVDLVFACITKIITTMMGLPLVLSTVDERIIESGPLWEILFKNPLMTFKKFITDWVGHYALTRDVFIVFTESAGIRPTEFLVVSGTQMRALTNRGGNQGELLGWEFNGGGGQLEKFTTLGVHQTRNFNPYDRFHGIGPATAAEQSINYTYAAELFNTAALQNGAEPGVILTSQNRLEKEQVDSLRSQFDARHAGAGKAKRTAILTGGLDIKTVAMNMVDMDVANLTTMSDKKICSAFGVPPGVVGLITEAQYSHGPAQEDFIFNTIIPIAELFASEITDGILLRFWSSDVRSLGLKESRFGKSSRVPTLSMNRSWRDACQKAVSNNRQVFAWFDYSQHPVVQRVKREQAEQVLKFTTSGVTLNQLIAAHDLPYEETDWGNHWWIPMGQVPADFTLEAGMEGLTGPVLPEGGTLEPKSVIDDNISADSADSAVKEKETAAERLWRSWTSSWIGIEREYQNALRLFFIHQQRSLISKLKTALSEIKSQSVKSVVKADADQVIARVTLDLKSEDNKLVLIHSSFFHKASELGVRQTLVEVLNLQGAELIAQVENVKLKQVIRRALIRSSQKLKSVNPNTQKKIANQLREGLEADEGINELESRVRQVLGANRTRALTIARLETGSAVSAGRHAGLEASGAKLKSWLSARDKAVRDSHRQAETDYAEGIPLEQPFKVGDATLMYPTDPAGPPEEIINCRCVELALMPAGKEIKQFYSYEKMKGDKNVS